MQRSAPVLPLIRKMVLLVSAVAFFIALGINAILDNQFIHYPKILDQSTGYIIPYEGKYGVVYITIQQHLIMVLLHIIEIVSGGFVLISAILHWLWPIKIQK